MLVIAEVFPCLGQKMSVYGPCYPVGVSECWGTELFKDFLIRRRNREFLVCYLKHMLRDLYPHTKKTQFMLLLLPIGGAESTLKIK